MRRGGGPEATQLGQQPDGGAGHRPRGEVLRQRAESRAPAAPPAGAPAGGANTADAGHGLAVHLGIVQSLRLRRVRVHFKPRTKGAAFSSGAFAAGACARAHVLLVDSRSCWSLRNEKHQRTVGPHLMA